MKELSNITRRPDYRLTAKVRNNRILARMEQSGMKTAAELARAAHVELSMLCDLINMKVTPENKFGEWRPWVLRIADTLYVTPEELFSNEQRGLALKTNRADVELTQDQLNEILHGHRATLELKQSVAKMLQDLTPRERRVLMLRFGLGCPDHTLEETARIVGAEEGWPDMTRERIRQVEAKALRKLRHPARLEAAGIDSIHDIKDEDNFSNE
jgi:hypothetical protein